VWTGNKGEVVVACNECGKQKKELENLAPLVREREKGVVDDSK